MCKKNKQTKFMDELYQATLLKIENKAKSMTLDQLDDLAAGTGFLTLLDEEEEFMNQLQTLPQITQDNMIEVILNKVYRIYCDKKV